MSINNISNIVLSGNPNTTLNIVDDDAAKSADLSMLQEDVTQLGYSLATETQNRETGDIQNATNIGNLDSELAEKLRAKSGDIVTFTDVFVNGEFDVISEIKPKQAGSGDPSRDNIRPITGYDSIKLSRTGKNLFGGDALADAIVAAGGTKDEEAKTVLFDADLGGTRTSLFTKFKPNTQYTFIIRGQVNASVQNLCVWYTEELYPGIKYERLSNFPSINVDGDVVYTSRAGKTISAFGTIYYTSAKTTLKYNQCGVFEGVITKEDFEPYKGNTFTINLGQTIYGGTFNQSTGELIINKETIILDGNEQQFDQVNPNNGNFYALKKIKPSVSHKSLICSHLISEWTAGYDYGYIYIANDDRSGTYSYLGSDIDTLEKANAWLKTQADNGIPFTICYELKDPITIQFSPQRISSIPKETNYLFGNTSITAQQNLAVNKAYVDKKLGDSGTNTVDGQYAVAFGQETNAKGDNSLAGGFNTQASGANSFSFGNTNDANGKCAVAFGNWNAADGDYSFVSGKNSTAYGDGSVSMGIDTMAGCKGYYISAIDPPNHKIYLYTGEIDPEHPPVPTWKDPSSKYDPNANLGYIWYGADPTISFPYEFSISANAYHHWVFAADVTNIDGNCITYSEQNRLNDVPKSEQSSLGYLKWMSNYDSDGDGVGNAKPMIFYIPAQPRVGNTALGLGSYAEGWQTRALGEHSHAQGWYTIAAGRYAHTEGDSTRAGYNGHAEGILTLALGLSAHAEGRETQATGDFSHAQGYESIASGKNSHAAGARTEATGNQSYAGGYFAQATNESAFAHGRPSAVKTENGVTTADEANITKASGISAVAMGTKARATGDYSTAIGYNVTAEGSGAVALGSGTSAIKNYAFAEGGGTKATALHAHAEGGSTEAKGGQSHAQGYNTIAEGRYSHAGGYGAHAKGEASIAHGLPKTSIVNDKTTIDERTVAEGISSIALGYAVKAIGDYSVAIGQDTIAGTTQKEDSTTGKNRRSRYSIAIGNGAQAIDDYSVAIGQSTQATGAGAAAFGIGNQANYYGTFTYGQGNIASYWNALAGGSISEAKHSNSTAIGRGTRTSKAYQTAIGLWNKDNTGALFIIGNGKETSDKESGRSTAFAVKSNGDVLVGSKTVHTGADYAEYFEWQDGNPEAEDRIGYIVTLDEDKIRLAQEGEEILGVISGTAGVIGDSGAMDWQGRFVKDAFGRIIYDEVEEFEEYIDPETQETIRVSLGMAKHPRISPSYNPEEKYIPREERPEWACVGMFGKLYVRDDGTCIPNAYARCVNGVLTYSNERTNIKIMKRTDSNIVYVFLK